MNSPKLTDFRKTQLRSYFGMYIAKPKSESKTELKTGRNLPNTSPTGQVQPFRRDAENKAERNSDKQNVKLAEIIPEMAEREQQYVA